MAESPTPDLLLINGTVLDPASGRCEPLDVAVGKSRIVALEKGLSREGIREIIDVSGCYVTPGLIDFHVHSYWGVNPYGMDADPVCLATGVTTAIDAGSSGPVNFPGFKRFIAQQSRTRMLAFVAIARTGVTRDPGELEDIRQADPEGAARTVRENPDVAIGIKVRLDERVGANATRALKMAVEAGDASDSPVMVHIGNSPITIEEIVETLRPGDIVTHCFTPQQPAIIDESGRLREAVSAAHERGVLFDAGHANGHMDFANVRAAMRDGLPPDIISTDLHGLGTRGFIGDLPKVLSKFLALGMSLEQVVAACTVAPARAIGWEKELGALEIGREADISVLALVEAATRMTDSSGAEFTAERRLEHRLTVRAGQVI